MSITIIAKSRVLPDRRQTYISLAKQLAHLSRREPGCLSYQLFEDPQNPQRFVLIEQWQDDRALRLHRESEHFIKMVPQLNALRVCAPEITYWAQLI